MNAWQDPRGEGVKRWATFSVPGFGGCAVGWGYEVSLIECLG